MHKLIGVPRTFGRDCKSILFMIYYFVSKKLRIML